MAVVDIYGARGRKHEADGLGVQARPVFYRGRVSHIVDSAAFADTDSVGSKCWLGKVPSHAVINPASTIYFGAFGTNCTLNIGDAKDADGLATVIAVSSAGNSPILEAISAQNFARPLWQHLGYARDPHQLLDLYASIAGAAVTTSTAWLTWNLMFSKG